LDTDNSHFDGIHGVVSKKVQSRRGSGGQQGVVDKIVQTSTE